MITGSGNQDGSLLWYARFLNLQSKCEMLLSSNCKDCNQVQARFLQASRLKIRTPEPQPTTPVSAPHSSINSPLCCSHVQLCASEVDVIPQPTRSVLTERLELRITVAPHCISTGKERCTIRDSSLDTDFH